MRLFPLLLVTACMTREPDPSLPNATSHVIELDIPQDTQPQLDLLFVIDSSPAMAGFRENLVANAATFANVLATLPSHLPDVQIAVTVADPTASGAFRAGPGGVTFLSSTTNYNGSFTRNFTGELADAMTAMFDVGASGSSVSQPLAAAKQALAMHPDFIRHDAYLAIVIVGAADDASSEQIAAYAQTFKALKSDPSDVVVAAIAGTGCTFGSATAADAPRLRGFLDQFPNRSTFTSICQQDLTSSLELIANLFKTTLGLVCLPAATGDCVASDEVNHVELGLLSNCNAAADNLPCFALVPDPASCLPENPQRFIIHRKVYPPRGDHLRLQCVVDE